MQMEESMQHLTDSSDITWDFWDGIFRLMRKVGIEYSRDNRFLILGLVGENKITCKEGLAILALAWRCLYAEITRSRAEDNEALLHKALARTVALLISRIKAYGEKWRKLVTE